MYKRAGGAKRARWHASQRAAHVKRALQAAKGSATNIAAGLGSHSASGIGGGLNFQQLQLHLSTPAHAVLPLPAGVAQRLQLDMRSTVGASGDQHSVAVGHLKAQVARQGDVPRLKLCSRWLGSMPCL